MYILSPITVLAILAVGLAGAALLAPRRPRAPAQATLKLPTATHQKLALWGRKKHAGAEDRRPLTVVPVVQELANRRGNDNEAAAH
jgi:hypothetical protein